MRWLLDKETLSMLAHKDSDFLRPTEILRDHMVDSSREEKLIKKNIPTDKGPRGKWGKLK